CSRPPAPNTASSTSRSTRRTSVGSKARVPSHEHRAAHRAAGGRRGSSWRRACSGSTCSDRARARAPAGCSGRGRRAAWHRQHRQPAARFAAAGPPSEGSARYAYRHRRKSSPWCRRNPFKSSRSPEESVVAKSKINAWYGWVPDRPDFRDKLYAAIAAPPKKLPPKVDLRAGCSPVENQGNLGSCTANALVGNLEFLEKKAGRRATNLSRLFVYYNERAMEGTISEDAGAAIRD